MVIVVSPMEKRSTLNAQEFCVSACERNVLCGYLSLRDIARRFLLRTAQDAVPVFKLSRSWDRRKSRSVRCFYRSFLTIDPSVSTLHSTSLSCAVHDTCIADVEFVMCPHHTHTSILDVPCFCMLPPRRSPPMRILVSSARIWLRVAYPHRGSS